MIEVRNPEQDLYRLRVRLGVAITLVVLCFGALVARFSFLQVYHFQQYHAQAEDNRISLVPVPPSRGLIYDRNGLLLADNVSAYTLELVPSVLEQSVDKTIDLLSEIVDIPQRDRRRFKRLLEDSHNFDSVPLKTRLTDEEVAKLAATRFRYPGVEIRARQFRVYPLGETASHAIGYIGRISLADKKRIEDDDKAANYAGSTHMGKTGIEESYEEQLHGQAGAEEVEVSAGGRTIRALSRTPAVPGSNLYLSLDIRMQKLIEDWFGPRKGALVAIDPKTGEVLAMVSKPTFDPNLFIDGIDQQSWKELNDDPAKPLLNRPLRGTYPPGSTYKPFMAMLVLQSGLRAPGYAISDPGYYTLGNHRYRDSVAGGHGSVDLRTSIRVSSDTYYYGAAYELGVDRIHDFMQPWGFGTLTGIDMNNEATGILPSSAWKMKRYKQKWLPGETPSIGIGQGYNSFTMLQMAHAAATLANNGVLMKPHVVRQIEDPVTRTRTPVANTPVGQIDAKKEWFDLVKLGMTDVIRAGTARTPFVGAEYQAAGKTGTAQVIAIKQNEKYDARRIAERFRDHSLFMAFAPADDPKIALALIVENGGWGAATAAPIARKVLDYYLLGKLPKENELPFPKPEELDDPEMRDIPDDLEPEPIDDPASASAGAPGATVAGAAGAAVGAAGARAALAGKPAAGAAPTLANAASNAANARPSAPVRPAAGGPAQPTASTLPGSPAAGQSKATVAQQAPTAAVQNKPAPPTPATVKPPAATAGAAARSAPTVPLAPASPAAATVPKAPSTPAVAKTTATSVPAHPLPAPAAKSAAAPASPPSPPSAKPQAAATPAKSPTAPTPAKPQAAAAPAKGAAAPAAAASAANSPSRATTVSAPKATTVASPPRSSVSAELPGGTGR